MNLEQAMNYATHADFQKETIACLCKLNKNYCSFILTYEVIEDEEPEDNGPRFSISYIASRFNDPYCVEGDDFWGANQTELTDDLIDVVSPDKLTFQVYQNTTDAEVIPYMYHDLMPDMIPDYDQVADVNFFWHQVDRVLHFINK